MTAPADPPPPSAPLPLTIGQLASAAGVSTRTVRYYEQRGLLSPTALSSGGARRYDHDSLERLQRIRELAAVLGSDLDDIGTMLHAEDQLALLREQKAKAGPGEDPRRRLVRLAAAGEINDGLRVQVHDHITRLQQMLAGLDERAENYDRLRAELTAILDSSLDHPTALATPDPKTVSRARRGRQ